MELEAVLADPRGSLVEEPRATGLKPLWMWTVSVVAAVVLTVAVTSAALWYFRPSPPKHVTRFFVPLAEGQQFQIPAARSL